MNIHIAPPCAIHELGKRDNQEDSIWPPLGMATTEDRLFLVCDGMGGHEHGEVASQTVVEAIGRYGEMHPMPKDGGVDAWLMNAIGEAYNQLDANDTAGDGRKMGTTLTLICLHRRGCAMAHIGDSRIYHIRPKEKKFLYVSRDHSLVMDLYLSGELKREEMQTYHGKNIITRCMQPGGERRPKADIVHTTNLSAGDYFMLCSDGVLEQLADWQLMDLLAQNCSDEEKCRRLKDVTADNADNHSAYLIRITEVEPENGDAEALSDEDVSRANMAVIDKEAYAEREQTSWWKRLFL
ncbi:MAG: serine/threonine-protein phosphatase, partial [Bacteroidaceae bacterium]|nr:serine/threonine-protein phosphatase [Bacteroidaceae bacterium]